MIQHKIIVLDFDGVICDSAFEAFRIAMYTAGAIKSAFDSSRDELYQNFYELRAYVGPAWNYYYVTKEILHGEKYAWHLNNEVELFEKNFFACRADAQSNKLAWLKLNPVYPKIREILSEFSYDILTNKNTEAVVEILNYHEFQYDNVFSMPEMKQFNSKVDFLNHRYRGYSVNFVDDHIDTVQIAREKSEINLSLAHAGWGYGNSSLDITIEIDEFRDWLVAHMN